MSPMLQRILIALGRRGVQTPVDQRLGQAYQALHYYQENHANIYPHACEILMAEIEGGATTIVDVPQRMADLVRMLDQLHRNEDLELWAQGCQVGGPAFSHGLAPLPVVGPSNGACCPRSHGCHGVPEASGQHLSETATTSAKPCPDRSGTPWQSRHSCFKAPAGSEARRLCQPHAATRCFRNLPQILSLWTALRKSKRHNRNVDGSAT
ncbi:MAG: hypothetical protein K0Q72_5367 [Armatimonadetes bacterium]|nr:hypothetical protein [Armatimonadota bacterium]